MVSQSELLVFANSSTHKKEPNVSHDGQPPHTILFLISSIFLGAMVRIVLKKFPVPYTVVLLIFGCIFGLVSSRVVDVQVYTSLARADPHVILHIFLPILLFESAFSTDVHTFMQSLPQVILLSTVGIVFTTVLTATLAINLFTEYNWSWTIAMLFGCILSATDPVAVVSILQELGISEKLTVMIEGESLLNDGSAIVMFNVISSLIKPGAEISLGNIMLSFVRITAGGSLFGLLMGKATVLCLSHIFNEAIVEITVTLTAAYMTFYVGEVFFHVSGIISVVILGLVINSQRTCISPEVERTLHVFWSTLAYLANTLIFVIVGTAITEKASVHIQRIDCFYIIALYFGINVIRGLMIMVLSPLLRRLGYGMTWKNGVIMTWGGLRGAIGLCLSLLAAQDETTGENQDKILVHCAGIVVLTLLINATTIKSLLDILGLSDVSYQKRLNMANTFEFLNEEQERSINMLKMDRFLADANWEMVKKSTLLKNPYALTETDDVLENLFGRKEAEVACRECDVLHERDKPTTMEYEEICNEARLRVVKTQRESYWKQYEHGMIARKTVQILIEINSRVGDKPDGKMSVADLRKHWQISPAYKYMKGKLQKMQQKEEETIRTPPTRRIRRLAFHLVHNKWFEITSYAIVLLNLIPITMELTLKKEDERFEEKMLTLKRVNIAFIAIYIVEAALKITGNGVKNYFHNHWNKIDFIILVLSCCDILVEFIYGMIELESPHMSLTFLNITKVLRLTRITRVVRLFRPIIPKMINAIDSRINQQLQVGYDVGRAFIVGEELTKRLIDRIVNEPAIAAPLKSHSDEQKVQVIKELGHLQQSHPGVAMSVKTRQAIRSVLNHTRETIHELQERGQLDEKEHKKLSLVVERRMKKLRKVPASIRPPSPKLLLKQIAWIDNDELIDYLMTNSRMKTFNEGDVIATQGSFPQGIHVIVSGMIKLVRDPIFDVKVGNIKLSSGELPNTDSFLFLEQNETQDFMSSGNVLGEMGILTSKPRNSTAICETAAQTFHVPLTAMKKALRIFKTQPSLEYRLWRCCSQKVAEFTMINDSKYLDWTLDQIQMHLDEAIMPNVDRTQNFNIYKGMDEVILIQGHATDAHSRQNYVAPTVVQKSARKITFHEQKNKCPPKLLIIPNADFLPDQHIQWAGNERDRRRSSIRCLHHSSNRRLSLGLNRRRNSLLPSRFEAKNVSLQSRNEQLPGEDKPYPISRMRFLSDFDVDANAKSDC